MATGESGERAASSRVVLQRGRQSMTRQVRSSRNLQVNVVAPAEAGDGKQAGQRRVARIRQSRTVKQRRAQDAVFRPVDIEIDIVIKMALRANARRSQTRQLNVMRAPALPASREELARLAVIKVDIARVAQGRQLSAAKLARREAT